MDNKRFVATDLEGTLSAGEAWRGIGAYLKTHGQASAHRRFFATHFVPALFAKAGIIDKQAFRNQWLADQAELLRGSTETELEAMGDWVVEHELWVKRRTNVIASLEQHHNAGCAIVIATGAYDPIANAFARKLGWQNILIASTPLEYKNGKFTGKFAGEMGVDAAKARRVKSIIGEGALVAAYGDTAADVPMLELSTKPVAVAPDSGLAKIASARGWQVLA